MHTPLRPERILLVRLALTSLLVLARLRIPLALRLIGAQLTATAAFGRLADRLGLPDPVIRTADEREIHTTLIRTTFTGTPLAVTGRTPATRRHTRPEPPEPLTGTTPEPHDRNPSRREPVLYFLVPKGSSCEDWDVPETAALGTDAYVVLPLGHRDAPPGPYWLVPEQRGGLTPAVVLRQALEEAQ